ncbi:GHMP kinase [Halobacteriales archaeon QS_8_69_26]|nr:MAG: GHMP kinase [Halobacteriales archaeon QS_8_69_26]
MLARAPGSVTGLFAPADGEGRSRGASFATEDGVVVEVTPAEKTTVTVDGDPTPFEPVELALDELGVTAAVAVRPEVPLGHGFGASGAATLAAALAADATFDLGRDREALLGVAHRAEMAAGTGQGDVYIQERGGLCYSSADGTGRVVPDEPVEYASVGGIDTGETLADEGLMDRFRRHGNEQIDALSDPPTMREFAERSRTLVRETGVATEFVEAELRRVRDAGGAGSMALFGDTVFAVGVEGVLDNRTRVAAEGARVLPGGEDV